MCDVKSKNQKLTMEQPVMKAPLLNLALKDTNNSRKYSYCEVAESTQIQKCLLHYCMLSVAKKEKPRSKTSVYQYRIFNKHQNWTAHDCASGTAATVNMHLYLVCPGQCLVGARTFRRSDNTVKPLLYGHPQQRPPISCGHFTRTLHVLIHCISGSMSSCRSQNIKVK